MSRMAELMNVLSHGADWREYFAPPRPRTTPAIAPAPTPQVVIKRRNIEQMVMDKLGAGAASTTDIAVALSRDWHNVRKAIGGLEKAGKVRRSGTGTATRWEKAPTNEGSENHA